MKHGAGDDARQVELAYALMVRRRLSVRWRGRWRLLVRLGATWSGERRWRQRLPARRGAGANKGGDGFEEDVFGRGKAGVLKEESGFGLRISELGKKSKSSQNSMKILNFEFLGLFQALSSRLLPTTTANTIRSLRNY